ncbi:MAG: hypothetical protein HRF43_16740, partial [Phycisphaerae bacterium]
LEHLAFSAVDSAGPFVVYLDGIDQPCPPTCDFDGDGDVDLNDFAHLQACLTGPGQPVTDPNCLDARLDNDGDVDAADMNVLRACLSGERIPADPACQP